MEWNIQPNIAVTGLQCLQSSKAEYFIRLFISSQILLAIPLLAWMRGRKI
jgi:hypothetical protein